MRQDWDIWLITMKQGADIKLNTASKTNEMGKSCINFKRSMKLLLKDMVGLKRDSHNLKEASQHGYQMQNRI